MGDNGDKYRGAIRQLPLKIARIEVIKGTCDDPWVMLRGLMAGVQLLKNRLYWTLESWHRERGNDRLVAEWMTALSAWHKDDTKTRGAKPTCPVKLVTSESSKAVYRDMVERNPGVHSRVLVLIMNREMADLSSRKGTLSAFKRWQRCFADLGERPTFSRPQPVPFDRGNVKLEKGDDGTWSLVGRFDRRDVPGKRGESVVLRLVIRSGGRHCAKVRNVLERCAAGEWKFCGSSIADRDGVCVLWCYREAKPETIDVDAAKVAVLKPSRRHPWSLRIEGRTRWVNGRGRLVKVIRRQCGEQRATRSESYRFGSKSRRGHGSRRAVYRVKNLEDNFKKTHNGHTVAAVLRWCADAGVGTIVFRAPSGRAASTRYLVTAGAGSRPGLWPWYQVETMLATQCERKGLVFQKTGKRVAAAPGEKMVSARKTRRKVKGRNGVAKSEVVATAK